MRVGQQIGGDKTMIFLRTDEEIPENILKALSELDLIIDVQAFEL
jgi:hypothetical protein